MGYAQTTVPGSRTSRNRDDKFGAACHLNVHCVHPCLQPTSRHGVYHMACCCDPCYAGPKISPDREDTIPGISLTKEELSRKVQEQLSWDRSLDSNVSSDLEPLIRRKKRTKSVDFVRDLRKGESTSEEKNEAERLDSEAEVKPSSMKTKYGSEVNGRSSVHVDSAVNTDNPLTEDLQKEVRRQQECKGDPSSCTSVQKPGKSEAKKNN
nr:PREDICTED: uncharacterized protein LOC106704476 [Latimeria chalumnae]|eukprot:XP_014347067.1 PREDICTED: uncharacterized protein LOC106704476 [Latimeria chalumnae]